MQAHGIKWYTSGKIFTAERFSKCQHYSPKLFLSFVLHKYLHLELRQISYPIHIWLHYPFACNLSYKSMVFIWSDSISCGFENAPSFSCICVFNMAMIYRIQFQLGGLNPSKIKFIYEYFNGMGMGWIVIISQTISFIAYFRITGNSLFHPPFCLQFPIA